MADALLELRQVTASYGKIQALGGISMAVPEKAIIALLGSNGAGKSTTLNVVSRLVPLGSGEVLLDGRPIHRIASDAVVGLGVVQVPEGREVFRDMTVRENLEMGAYLQRDRAKMRQDMDRVCTFFPRLSERLSQKAATLSGGEQQMLAIGRALMARPRLILLDEPSMGLSPLLVQGIFENIARLNQDEGITFLVVEQNVKLALAISSYAYILENGEIALEGESATLADDEGVRRAYLGG